MRPRHWSLFRHSNRRGRMSGSPKNAAKCEAILHKLWHKKSIVRDAIFSSHPPIQLGLKPASRGVGLWIHLSRCPRESALPSTVSHVPVAGWWCRIFRSGPERTAIHIRAWESSCLGVLHSSLRSSTSGILPKAWTARSSSYCSARTAKFCPPRS